MRRIDEPRSIHAEAETTIDVSMRPPLRVRTPDEGATFDQMLELARREQATVLLPAEGIDEEALRAYLDERDVPMLVLDEVAAARERHVFQLVLVTPIEP